MDGSESILKTLLYSDIFDYPLTKEEIFKFLISKNKISKQSFTKLLKSDIRSVDKIKKLYFIKGKNNLVSKRVKRNNLSVTKLKFAKKIIKKISIIPTIKFVGISGALSMMNSDEEDDIDIFVISENKLAWTTRFFLIVLLMLLGVYRTRTAKSVKNKICLNMLLDESNMDFSEKYHDLFTAHEIIQMIPVFEKDKIYTKFLKSNNWTDNFLPNAGNLKKNKHIKRKSSMFENLIVLGLNLIFLEKILEFTQKAYMKKYVTNETIKNGFLAFHPIDYRKIILKSYALKLKKYEPRMHSKNY